MYDDTLRIIDDWTRPCAVAAAGLAPNPRDSLSGHPMLMRPSEDWPTGADGPFDSVIQIRIAEVPVVPSSIVGAGLITVFADPVGSALHEMLENGNGWELRVYSSVDDLVPKNPPIGTFPNPERITWERGNDEGPRWADITLILSEIGHEELAANNEFFEAAALSHRYSQHFGTKVGGWPTPCQAVGFDTSLSFAFQVITSWGGIMCVFKSLSGGWKMYQDAS